MRLKTIILASFLGLVFFINYGCGFHLGASIGKADRDIKEQSYMVQYPIKKDNKRLSQTNRPQDG